MSWVFGRDPVILYWSFMRAVDLVRPYGPLGREMGVRDRAIDVALGPSYQFQPLEGQTECEYCDEGQGINNITRVCFDCGVSQVCFQAAFDHFACIE